MRPEESRWHLRPATGRTTRGLQPPERTPGAPAPEPGGDHFQGQRQAGRDVPHWVIAMSADRASGRRYLPPGALADAREVERAWIAGWVARLPDSLPVPGATGTSAGRLAAWQAWVDDLCHHAGTPLPRAHVVWQPAMGVHRGQYLFQTDTPLIQLRPNAAGTPSEWLATVAHETYHHAQHALLTALYQGRPAWPAPFDLLAAYFRDARNVYRGEGPACPPATHRQQELELGAWRFGRLVGARAVGPG
ncbi:MAG: hypothetical protein VKQ33_11585 [Candidatus Sericytochromatia bacterium]|nr:hypothetical protein [Candidatus Sericytochromatia bacterium]